MNFERSTILLTSIDEQELALAKKLVALGSRVIASSKRKDRLEKARRLLPELCTIECDIALESGRLSLFSKVTKKFPSFNVLIHTAPKQDVVMNNLQDWDYQKSILALNFEATIHLSLLFFPHLQKQKESYIVNLISQSKQADSPTRAAAQEGLKAFFKTLRDELSNSSITIVEATPKAFLEQELMTC